MNGRSRGAGDFRTSGRQAGYSAPLTAEQVRRRWLRVRLLRALGRTSLPVAIALLCLAAFAVPLLWKVL